MRLHAGSITPEISDDAKALENLGERIGAAQDRNVDIEPEVTIDHSSAVMVVTGMRDVSLEMLHELLPEGAQRDQLVASLEIMSSLAVDGMVASKRLGQVVGSNADILLK